MLSLFLMNKDVYIQFMLLLFYVVHKSHLVTISNRDSIGLATELTTCQ